MHSKHAEQEIVRRSIPRAWLDAVLDASISGLLNRGIPTFSNPLCSREWEDVFG